METHLDRVGETERELEGKRESKSERVRQRERSVDLTEAAKFVCVSLLELGLVYWDWEQGWNRGVAMFENISFGNC